MDQNNTIKTKCPNTEGVKVPHKMVAIAVGCPVETVRSVLNRRRSATTDLGQRIEVAEMLLEEGQNKLLAEVTRIVRIK